MGLDRRTLLKFSGLSPAALALPRRVSAETPRSGVFAHGVASGDPLHDRVILWTRISGPKGLDHIEVNWQVAEDHNFSRVIASGQSVADATRDFCVKVDASGLMPGQSYVYRFQALGETSPLGHTLTFPSAGLKPLTLAVASCSNFPAGFFTAYRDIANDPDVDVLIHLGDYIYEYGIAGYASQYAEALGRRSVPAHDLLTLDDYRLRHAQYKSDPDLQAVHAAKPLIAVWDDHEVANDAWLDGAENHNAAEQGDWHARRRQGFQAYEEWMPVRTPNLVEDGRLFRAFNVGELLSLHMLDTRFYGRDAQLDPMAFRDQPEALERLRQDPDRKLLGDEQLAWLEQGLRQQSARWQVIGQQVLVSELLLPDLSEMLNIEAARASVGDQIVDAVLQIGGQRMPIMWDCWDGYAGARERFLTVLENHASSPVILTGDIHTSMAGNLHRRGQDSVSAVELVTTSISSPGFDDYLPTHQRGQLSEAFVAYNRHLLYMESARRGWLKVRLTADQCDASWHLVNRVDRRNQPVRRHAQWTTPHKSSGEYGLKPLDG
jgi:alkaline phosphatase D